MAQFVDSQNDTSPFETVSITDQTNSLDMLSGDIYGTHYKLRIQSNHFCDDVKSYSSFEIKKLIKQDLFERVTEVGENLAGIMFPDTAFGFPINDQLVENFYGSFLTTGGGLDSANFVDEMSTATFLNRTISTIAHFLHATGQVSLKPLRYFTSANSNKALKGHSIKRKPDIILLRLIDGYLRSDETIAWHNVQALVEHTREKKPPQRLPDTVTIKSYIAFCSQPERDFLVCLCITGKGFHIVMTDHVGQVETDFIPFTRNLVFFRIVMGLAFLPDSFLGVDTTMTRNEDDKPSNIAFATEYLHYQYNVPKPSIVLLASSSGSSVDGPFAVTSPPASTLPPMSPCGISTISIGSNVYKVLHLLFSTQTLIGRATRVFLVQLPDNRYGVLKDSWITVDRVQEAEFLKGLQIPFGPELIDHCVLRNSNTFRKHPVKQSLSRECREKRRVVTYPAGVHISDFACLWELLIAILDIVIAILYLETHNKVHRDISYTNILLRGMDNSDNPDARKAVRMKIMQQLGLSEIEELRNRLNSREGLLIDFDYASTLVKEEIASDKVETNSEDRGEGPSGDRTGTPPFIAIELLLYKVPHRVAHDLESLLYVLLFICTHLGGPRVTVGQPPLLGEGSCHHPSSMKKWLCSTQFNNLGDLKFSHMVGFFETSILPFISTYFKPLQEPISLLWNKILPQRHTQPSVGQDSVKSVVTCFDIIEVFKIVLLDESLIRQAENELQAASTSLGKHSLPGDLDVASNGWDVVRPQKKLLMAEPKTNPPSMRRQAKLMRKGV